MKNIKYALIGLAPYSFHYDLSKTFGSENWRLLQYLIAFDDIHNFWLPPEIYRGLFNQEFLLQRLSLDNFDTNNVYIEKRFARPLGWAERIIARNGIDVWKNKNYPETRNENIKILDNYLTLCEENDIRPLIFLPPFSEGYIKHFSKQKIDEFYYLVREAQKKHPSAAFVDGWKIQGFSDADFGDVDHLNFQGAAKFSTILNDVIENIESKI